ncbi:integrator complex subunit 8-like [Acanthochromis polyacanthus]|uniref:integrator complex subunit 8-like n=1 Tax=Acanthochromis polyacanthus TaxID=80966 RepID=UPI0022346D91|nr:integrator complex subunit 8-like [Acanthochromis polyacanthus]
MDLRLMDVEGYVGVAVEVHRDATGSVDYAVEHPPAVGFPETIWIFDDDDAPIFYDVLAPYEEEEDPEGEDREEEDPEEEDSEEEDPETEDSDAWSDWSTSEDSGYDSLDEDEEDLEDGEEEDGRPRSPLVQRLPPPAGAPVIAAPAAPPEDLAVHISSFLKRIREECDVEAQVSTKRQRVSEEDDAQPGPSTSSTDHKSVGVAAPVVYSELLERFLNIFIFFLLICSRSDPTPVQLIVQFLEQASKPSVNEQNQVQPPADNRRNRTLKLLALKVAAHMKWDLDSLEKGLTIPVLNMLLNELLCVSKVPPGVKHVDLDLSTLPPTTAMAVIIYNRWAIRTIVLSSFPEKQTKPGPHQINMLNIVQQEKEMTENILTVLKEQATDSITVLEGALQLKKDFYVHTLRTLDLLAADAAANGETESSTAGLRISADDLHCQVHYDLGGIFFQQGCTDQPTYEKARDHFRQTKELLKKLDSTVHVHLDEKRLAGYWNACRALTGDCDPCDPQTTPYDQINSLIRAHNHQAVMEAFIKDNVSRSLPNHFRRSVLREFLYKVQQGESGLDEVCHQLCVCNAVRDALEGEILSIRFQQLLLKPSKRIVDFILEVVYDKGEIYSFSKHGRFCHEIKMNYSPYTNYFTRVFWNRSYHVYKVNSVISFQY